MRRPTAIGLAAAGLLVCGAGPDTPDADVRAAVDARAAEWWPSAAEKRFDAVGWAPDLGTARKLAADHNRPVFLFTMDGRVNLGRC